MAITSADIENQSFSISKKGYDVDEVDVFLEHVAAEIDKLNAQIASLKSTDVNVQADVNSALDSLSSETVASEPIDAAEFSESSESGDLTEKLAAAEKKIKDLQAKLDNKVADDSAISQALIVAQRSADDIINNANAKADDTIQDAHDEADRIINRAETEKQNIMDAISKLQDDREATRNEFAGMLRDFISDSNDKLISLGFDDDVENIPFDVDVPNSDTPVVPATENANIPSHVVEKDLSGFGDIAEDDDLD